MTAPSPDNCEDADPSPCIHAPKGAGDPIGRIISFLVLGHTDREHPIEDTISDAAFEAAEKHGFDVVGSSGPYFEGGDETALRLTEVTADRDRIRNATGTICNEVEQILGKALGYPLYGPDMFPPGMEPNGDVCVGDHVPQSLAAEAADRIAELTADRDRARDVAVALEQELAEVTAHRDRYQLDLQAIAMSSVHPANTKAVRLIKHASEALEVKP